MTVKSVRQLLAVYLFNTMIYIDLSCLAWDIVTEDNTLLDIFLDNPASSVKEETGSLKVNCSFVSAIWR